jgi:hypothetical protein
MKQNLLRGIKRKVKMTNVKCHYNNLQYDFDIPAEEKVTFKDVLNNFGSSYFEIDRTYKHFQVYRNEYIELNENIHDHDLTKPFSIYDFELTKKSLLNRTGKQDISQLEFPNLYLYEMYLHQIKPLPLRILPSITDVVLKDIARNVFNKNSNFFYYLLDKFNANRVKQELIDKFVNLEWGLSGIEKTENNRISLPGKHDHRQFLIDLLSPFVEHRNDMDGGNKYILDIEYFHSGIDSEEYKCDIMVKAIDDTFFLPVSIIDPFDTSKLETNLRSKDKADKLFTESFIGI